MEPQEPNLPPDNEPRPMEPPASAPADVAGACDSSRQPVPETQPATQPAYRPYRAESSVRLGMPARVVVLWATTSPASAPSKQESATSGRVETVPEKR